MSSVNSNSRIFQNIVSRGVKDISVFVEKLIVYGQSRKLIVQSSKF
jgi:hypothetical protein